MTIVIEQYENLDTFKKELHRNAAKKLFYTVSVKQARVEEPQAGMLATGVLVMTALYEDKAVEKIMVHEQPIAEGVLVGQQDMDDFNAEIGTILTNVIAELQKDIPALNGRIFKGNMRVI